jgi:hypothetical protein
MITKNYPKPHVYISPKKGVGLTSGYCPAKLNCDELKALRISWGFTWWPSIPRDLTGCTDYNDEPIETVAMLWGSYAVERPYLLTGANSDYLLTFNEPDHHGQANMSPHVAARAWYTIEHYYPDKKLIAPAPVISLNWLDRFVDAYVSRYNRLPRFDALAGHCYPGTLQHCQHVVEYLSERLQRWNVPEGIWINEYAVFAPPGWTIEQYVWMIRSMDQTTRYLEHHPNIDRYAWWTTRYADNEPWNPGNLESRLLFCNHHELTLLGHAYANLTPEPTTNTLRDRTEPLKIAPYTPGAYKDLYRP